MNRLLNILSLTISITSFLASCTKSTEKFTPYSSAELNDVSWSATQMPLSKQQAIIAALSKPNFIDSFNSYNGDTLNVNNNLQVAFPGNSCLLNGLNYTGSVSTTLKQLITKGDFVRNLTSSCNSNNLYDSKGVFLLNLADNAANSLSLASGTQYDLSLADSNISQGYVYVSGSIISPNLDSINWKIADSFEVGYLTNSSILVNGVTKKAYKVKSKELSWINIATPIKKSAVASFNVALGVSNFTNKNTAVFAVFKDYNTVIKLKSDVASQTFVAENIPIGSNINLVSISYIDGQFYIGKQLITVSNIAQYSIKSSVSPVTISNVNSFLDAL